VGRRPRKSAGRDLPQGHRRQDERKPRIEIWGDGQQTRSFMYIADCLKGIYMISESDTWHDPINLGSAEGVTINQLVDIVEDIAQIKLKRKYNLNAPKGVNGRNSDNTLINKSSAGSPTPSSAPAWKSPTAGSTTNGEQGEVQIEP